MKQIFILLLAIISFSSLGQSITISPNGTSALIDANSTTKGFLPPRMSMAQRAALTLSPGLQVYCNDCSPAGPYSYDGIQWKAMFNFNTTAPTYSVGQQAQGGIVIWVDDSGQHGLVAAPVDVQDSGSQVSGISWAADTPNQTLVMAMGEGVYDGKENTKNIIKKHGWFSYAAFLCRQTSFNRYGGWYLPSVEELKIMYENRAYLSNLSTYSTKYWSSTENGDNTAIMIDFSNGTVVTKNKTAFNEAFLPLRARAVRKF